MTEPIDDDVLDRLRGVLREIAETESSIRRLNGSLRAAKEDLARLCRRRDALHEEIAGANPMPLFPAGTPQLPAGQPAGTVGHAIGCGAGPLHGIDALDRPATSPLTVKGDDAPRRADTFEECGELARAIVLDLVDERDRKTREWTQLVANGGTDREILDALRETFDADEFVSGTHVGADDGGRTYTFHGSPPALWVGWHLSIDGNELPAPTLRTEELVRHVRVWLAIPQAGAARIVAEEPGDPDPDSRDVTCPHCGATPGKACFGGRGPTTPTHQARHEAAKRAARKAARKAELGEKKARKGKAVAR
jgi:hypothetical protein